jgi:hypothetical protein
MMLPSIPAPRPIDVLSPTLYASMLRCGAQAVWRAHGNRTAVPQHPQAVLGICTHSLLAAAHRGQLHGKDQDERLAAARAYFDSRADELWSTAHPLLKAKFGEPRRLPYYNLSRERSAMAASAIAADHPPGAGKPFTGPLKFKQDLTETNLKSKDGLLAGRPDYLNQAAKEVTDYKSSKGGKSLSPSEERQLLLYAHLARENGITVETGVVVRVDGQRAATALAPERVEAEGRAAREALAEFNKTAVGKTFEELAKPSAENCAHCPCVPFCAPFWRSAVPEWAELTGKNIEGTVAAIDESVVQGVTLKTYKLDNCRGTVDGAGVYLEQVPETWINADGTQLPRIGEAVRLVHGQVDDNGNPVVARMERVSSSFWTVT